MSAQTTELADLVSFPLSPQQELLWELGVEEPAYRAQCAVEVPSDWTSDRLRDALETIARRHEILRTVFVRRPGLRLPSQAVLERLAPSWEVETAVEEPPGAGDLVDRLLAEEATFTFDLERGPVLRVRHVVAARGPGLLVLTAPSITADGASLVAIVGELASALAQVGSADVPEEPLQYADYAGWRNETTAEAGSGGAQAPKEVGVSPVLLFGRRAAPTEPFAAARVRVPLDEHVVSRIEGAAAAYRTTEALFAQACWHACVARIATAPDVTIALVSDGRSHAELKGAVGAYAQASPVTTLSEPDTTLAEIVDQVRRAAEDLGRRQDSLDAAGLAESTARCSISFAALDARSASPLLVSTVFARPTRFDLQLCWIETDTGPSAEIQYSPAVYTHDDVLRIVSCFATLLASAVATPDAAIASLELTTPAELKQLVEDLNRAEREFPQRCVHELFEEQAGRTPERAAVRCGDSSLSYRELNARANGVARCLRELGVGSGSSVGLCLQRSVEVIVALLGILKAGGSYVPLNFEHPLSRLAHQLGEADVEVVVTKRELSDRLPPHEGPILFVDDAEDAVTDDNPQPVASPDNLVYVMYTSGSTGLPKGVEVTHRNLVNYATAIADLLGAVDDLGDDGLQFGVVSAISTDLGNTGIFPPLVSGGCIHLVEPTVAMDGDLFASYTAEHPIDVLKITPSHLSSLLASTEGESVLPRKCLVTGGEALSWELVAEIRSRSPLLRILNHYGPTETTVGCCTFELETDVSAWRPGTVPIGRPLANTNAYVVDARSVPVPLGVAGELLIGGAGVARGYVNRPDETALRFQPDPFRPDEWIYRTGDRARYLPDGNIEFLGRLDQQIKIRGFRVEPGEVEATLQRHPSIRQVAVVPREDGHGDPRLVGYVVASPEVGSEELQAFLSDTLPDFMVPSSFVTLDAMPLTPSGKIDRLSLPDPVAADAEREARYVAPRDEIERELAGIWADLLGVERVGVFDDFFALGGHSLLATQVIMRVRRAFGDIPLQAMFIAPTVAGLADVVRAKTGSGATTT